MGKIAVQTRERTQDPQSLFSAVPAVTSSTPPTAPHSFQGFPASLHRHPVHSQAPSTFQNQCMCAPGPGTERSLAAPTTAAPTQQVCAPCAKTSTAPSPALQLMQQITHRAEAPCAWPDQIFSAVKQHEVSWEIQARGIFSTTLLIHSCAAEVPDWPRSAFSPCAVSFSSLHKPVPLLK